jgi:hypothetical protein
LIRDHEECAACLPNELARSIYNQESRYLLGAGLHRRPDRHRVTGLRATSGTLIRAVDTGNNEAPLDIANLMIKEPAMSETTVKVRVLAPYRVVHEGEPYSDGDEVTVPEAVAAHWERSRSIERLTRNPAPEN